MKGFEFTAILFLLCLVGPVSAQATPFQKAIVRIEAKTKKPDDQGKQEVVLHLTIAKGFCIYAVGPREIQSIGAKVTINSMDGKPVLATVAYPKGKRIDDGVLGDYFIYIGRITIPVTVIRTGIKGPLQVKCRLGGYHLPPAVY